MLIYFDQLDLLIGVGLLLIILSILWLRKRSLSYLLFFSIFWIYLLAVVSVVIFPIAINTDYGGVAFKPSINFIPFYFGDNCFISDLCGRGILDNIILTIPFGFGINFLLRIKPKNVLWLALTVGFGFELSQFVISVAFRSEFRAVDINDVLLNAAGVLLGYVLFRFFTWVYIKMILGYKIKPKWLFADIYDITFQAQDKTK